jgi:hypothetical protein
MRFMELTFGVRYDPHHSIIDNIGSVMDQVLRAKDSPFGPIEFPLLQSLPHEGRLMNNDSGAVLRITARDAILVLPADSGNLDSLRKLASDFDNFVLEPLRRVTRLGDISRYGVVVTLIGTSKDLNNPPVKRYRDQNSRNQTASIFVVPSDSLRTKP